jgi:hypothetical protein
MKIELFTVQFWIYFSSVHHSWYFIVIVFEYVRVEVCAQPILRTYPGKVHTIYNHFRMWALGNDFLQFPPSFFSEEQYQGPGLLVEYIYNDKCILFHGKEHLSY